MRSNVCGFKIKCELFAFFFLFWGNWDKFVAFSFWKILIFLVKMVKSFLALFWIKWILWISKYLPIKFNGVHVYNITCDFLSIECGVWESLCYFMWIYLYWRTRDEMAIVTLYKIFYSYLKYDLNSVFSFCSVRFICREL